MSSLDNLIRSMPKWLFVGITLVLGIIVIMLINPPHSVCTPQTEQVEARQKGFLFLDPTKAYIKTKGIETALDTCRVGNSPGACQELFNRMNLLLKDIDTVSSECVDEIVSKNEIKEAILETEELIVRLAWGAKPPASYLDRSSWLDMSHMNTFCRLKAYAFKERGKEGWDTWREAIMKDFPGAEKMRRDEIWRRSLFSVSCKDFL